MDPVSEIRVPNFQRDSRVIKNLRTLCDSVDRDRRQYWREWQLEVRENKELRGAVDASHSEAQRALSRAHRAESDRRSLSRSLLKASSGRDGRRTACPQCAQGADQFRQSHESLLALTEALQDQVIAEKQLRSELRKAIRERLVHVERDRTMIESENARLCEKLRESQSLVYELRTERKSANAVQTVEGALIRPVVISDAMAQTSTITAHDACTETHTQVRKLTRANSSLRRQCRE